VAFVIGADAAAGWGVGFGRGAAAVVVVDSTTCAAGMTTVVSGPAASLVLPWLAHPAPKSTSSTAAVAIRRVTMT
jgi:hypothetical protein